MEIFFTNSMKKLKLLNTCKLSKIEFHRICGKHVHKIFKKIWKFQFHKNLEILIPQNYGNLNATKNMEISIPNCGKSQIHRNALHNICGN